MCGRDIFCKLEICYVDERKLYVYSGGEPFSNTLSRKEGNEKGCGFFLSCYLSSVAELNLRPHACTNSVKKTKF
jgi:hypothetical protein